MNAPSVGLALIVKDEEKHLRTLLASIDGAFDQVVLLDTGSRDKTVSVFRRWAKQQSAAHKDFTSKVERFKWIDDFAAARNAAQDLLDTEWQVWADADDEIVGAQNLRALAAQAPPDLIAFVCGYDYAQDQHGNCACYLRRERLVRAGTTKWVGRVHESQVFEGRAEDVDPSVVLWRHRKQHALDASSGRNLKILNAWVEEEPDNTRVLGYLGTEHMVKGEFTEAIPYFERYLKLPDGWSEERAQICRKLAVCGMAAGVIDGAIKVAFDAIALVPSWPDSYLSLAEAFHQKAEYDKTLFWVERVLELGQPESLLIINPLDYSLAPLVLKASALGALGRFEEALAVSEQALRIVPDQPNLESARRDWSASLKRNATAHTFIAAAEQLVAHDEQLKALTLIEKTVPYYATDHPEVVAMRSKLRERIRPLLEPDEYAEHYATGGSKPEDFIDDENVQPLGDSLPRCAFLLEGIGEQLEEIGAAA